MKARCVWRNTVAPSRKHFCLWKVIRVTYSEFLSVALVIQNAMRMRRIILSSVACPTLPYLPHYIAICGLSNSTIFTTLSHNWHDFRKKKLMKIKCVFWFCLQVLSEIHVFLILKKNWAIYDQMWTQFFTLSTRNSCQILPKLEFPYSGSWFVPCGRRYVRTEGQADRPIRRRI